ncbi:MULTISPECIES: Fur family transcriptional regulator [Streptomyces]|jgi:Fur family ferric uptake transcriptional regulator|uniref:Fur family transcriptional regulator n=1 Tax=Streptomyces TaxID=1883 RepID=UPI000D0B68CC|nr:MULTISPECIES: transcriptional repressor [unclassified Streptomyces]MCK1817325.1 transcriptional repressor [Streptomyces sp. XM4011]
MARSIERGEPLVGRRKRERTPPDAPGPRPARRREAVSRLLAGCGEFVSARQLHALAVLQEVDVSLTTVYRALNELEEQGCADVVLDGNGERLYRPRTAGEHRHYLLCRDCGVSRVLDAAVVETWTERVGEETGFAALEHLVQLSGICGPCQSTDPAGRAPGATAGE